mgnify:CR=1 FL=1
MHLPQRIKLTVPVIGTWRRVLLSLETAREILNYAKEELDKALRLNDLFLYRNAADKAFLALIVAINAYIEAKEGVTPRSHSERRRILRKMGREDL